MLQASTRTGRIRVELSNPALELKPDMYAEVKLKGEGGARLQVPESAVLYTGPRRLVFVDLGEGRLTPREVKLGVRAGEAYEVLEGLKSGNFLVAAESRIRSAAEHWGGGEHATH
jgi:Cu(I)/Ag(I) efflux system membrane fusion protein